jgi:hypothetical protein
MRRYWIRIALGALGIFALGMVIVRAGRQGVDHVKQLATQHILNLTPGVAPFQVDTRRLGTLTEVEVDPDRSERFPFVELTVELDPAMGGTAGLSNCTLLATDTEAFKDKGLRCVPGLSTDSLLEMGQVTFEPSGEVMAMYIPASNVKDFPWFQSSEAAGSATSSGASFNLQANAAGALMLIKDDKGRPVFQLNADSQGAFIQIRDSNGKEVVRFRADSQGVVGRVEAD